MNKQIGAAEMRRIAEVINKRLKGLGFALFIFEFNKPGLANYIYNAERETMLKAMKESYFRLSNGEDINTPEEN